MPYIGPKAAINIARTVAPAATRLARAGAEAVAGAVTEAAAGAAGQVAAGTVKALASRFEGSGSQVASPQLPSSRAASAARLALSFNNGLTSQPIERRLRVKARTPHLAARAAEDGAPDVSDGQQELANRQTDKQGRGSGGGDRDTGAGTGKQLSFPDQAEVTPDRQDAAATVPERKSADEAMGIRDEDPPAYRAEHEPTRLPDEPLLPDQARDTKVAAPSLPGTAAGTPAAPESPAHKGSHIDDMQTRMQSQMDESYDRQIKMQMMQNNMKEKFALVDIANSMQNDSIQKWKLT